MARSTSRPGGVRPSGTPPPFAPPYSQLFHVVHGRCHDLPRLTEFSGFILKYFTLSRWTVLTEVSLLQPEDSHIPLFKAVVYSVSWVRKLVNCSMMEKTTILRSLESVEDRCTYEGSRRLEFSIAQRYVFLFVCVCLTLCFLRSCARNVSF